MATSESPPQAQLIAPAAAFAIAPGTTSLTVAIAPVAPQPPAGVVGNAYRYSVTDAQGTAATVASESQVTVVLRAPLGTSGAQVAILEGGDWQSLVTTEAGLPGVYTANTANLGDLAILGTLPLPPARAASISSFGSASWSSPLVSPSSCCSGGGRGQPPTTVDRAAAARQGSIETLPEAARMMPHRLDLAIARWR